jgi:quercetin dioxygenase-like cupin family protein
MVRDTPVSGRLTKYSGRRAPRSNRVTRAMQNEGLSPYAWSSPPGETYEVHSHDFHDIVVCVAGDIIFHIDGMDMHLFPGDRLEMHAGTMHSATVGPRGVSCLEAKT